MNRLRRNVAAALILALLIVAGPLSFRSATAQEGTAAAASEVAQEVAQEATQEATQDQADTAPSDVPHDDDTKPELSVCHVATAGFIHNMMFVNVIGEGPTQDEAIDCAKQLARWHVYADCHASETPYFHYIFSSQEQRPEPCVCSCDSDLAPERQPVFKKYDLRLTSADGLRIRTIEYRVVANTREVSDKSATEHARLRAIVEFGPDASGVVVSDLK